MAGKDSFFPNIPERLGTVLGNSTFRDSHVNTGGGFPYMNDMVLHNDTLAVVFLDGSASGPFVKVWNDSTETWEQIGGELEIRDSVLSRRDVKIASDGTNLYVAYTATTRDPIPDDHTTALIGGRLNVCIQKWDGASWSFLYEDVGKWDFIETGVVVGLGLKLEASGADPGRCHASWYRHINAPTIAHDYEFSYLTEGTYYWNSDMGSPMRLFMSTVLEPTFVSGWVINANGRGALRVDSGVPYLFCNVDFFIKQRDGGLGNYSPFLRMTDCRTGATVQRLDASLWGGDDTSVPSIPPGDSVWGFVRLGSSFPGNHPDYDLAKDLGCTGILWKDDDPNLAAGLASTAAAGLATGIWTVGGGNAATFAGHCSDLVNSYGPSLLVMDNEFVAKGYDPSPGWTWNDDVVAAYRAAQPTQTTAVTMLPLQDDFNYAVYTAAGFTIWPQSYGAEVGPDDINPVTIIDRVASNGVDRALIWPVLPWDAYVDDVALIRAAGTSNWSVYTLDDLQGSTALPDLTGPTDEDTSGDASTKDVGVPFGVSHKITRSGRDLYYLMMSGHDLGAAIGLTLVQIPIDASGPFELFENSFAAARVPWADTFAAITADSPTPGNGWFTHDVVNDNLYYMSGPVQTFPTRTAVWRKTCPGDPRVREWALLGHNISFGGQAGDCTFPPVSDPYIYASSDLAVNGAPCRAYIVGEHVYVLAYWFGQGIVGGDLSDPLDPHNCQHIVYKQVICRGCVSCGSEVTTFPILEASFRAERSTTSAPTGSVVPVQLSGASFRVEKGTVSGTHSTTGAVHLQASFRAASQNAPSDHG
jgi:hypothetical protein